MKYTEFRQKFGGSARTNYILGSYSRKHGWPLRALLELTGIFGLGRRRRGRPYKLPPVGGLPPEYIRLDPWELEYLYLVASRAKTGILEIGRRHGGSTFALACANPEVPIHSIDLEPADDDRLRGFFRSHGVGENVRLVVGDSQKTQYPEIETFDVLFIDGDHSYQGCTNDIYNWYDKLAVGGHMIFHDCYLGLEVQDAVLDFVAGHDVTMVQTPYIGAEWWSYPAGSIAHLIKR
jgi:precorrin-6B methylase 2